MLFILDDISRSIRAHFFFIFTAVAIGLGFTAACTRGCAGRIAEHIKILTVKRDIRFRR